MKIINAIWMLLLILGVTVLYVKNGGLQSTGVTEKEATEQETMKDKIPEQTAKDLPPMTDLNQDCRKGVNVERPECVEWFNNYSNATATYISSSYSGFIQSERPLCISARSIY